MKIAVLSGKGGTGKTFVSVNLACAADQAAYVDCDVEEPNGHLFLKPNISEHIDITVSTPEVEQSKCTSCRKCVDFCKYNALALIKNRLMVFDEICHSCGGCILFCPEKALTTKHRKIGVIETGTSGNVQVLTGTLNVGEVSGIPIIKTLIDMIPTCGIAIIDCPPGSACVVMESIRKADYCVLIAEPTTYGVHNLAMVHALVKLFEKPFGVVLNKCMNGFNPALEYCVDHNVTVLETIPYSAELGAMTSKGIIASRESTHYTTLFRRLYERIAKEAAK